MSSIREQILAAIVAALNVAPPVGVPVAIRARLDAPTASQLPAITVYPFAKSTRRPHGRTSPILDRKLVVCVEILSASSPTQTADQGLDPSYTHVANTLNGSRLGNLASDVIESEEMAPFEYGQSTDASFCRDPVLFDVSYTTRASDASVKA